MRLQDLAKAPLMGVAYKGAGGDASRQEQRSQRGMRQGQRGMMQGLCLSLMLACHVKKVRSC